MVWNWDKDDIRGRERERERREGEREYLRKIYTIILNIYVLVLNTLIIEIYLELLDHTIYLYLHWNNMCGYGKGDITIRSLYYL